jgi:serine/threonine protein kinase
MRLTPGTTLGPYEILAPQGRVVWERSSTLAIPLDRIVALKILPASVASDPHLRERFEREARVISQLDHPHICALYDVGGQEWRRVSRHAVP